MYCWNDWGALLMLTTLIIIGGLVALVWLVIIMIFLMIFEWIRLGLHVKMNGISNYFIKSVDIYFDKSIVTTSAANNQPGE